LHALNVQYAFISVYTNILTLMFNLRMKDQSIKNVVPFKSLSFLTRTARRFNLRPSLGVIVRVEHQSHVEPLMLGLSQLLHALPSPHSLSTGKGINEKLLVCILHL
jgi:hypothetical protein